MQTNVNDFVNTCIYFYYFQDYDFFVNADDSSDSCNVITALVSYYRGKKSDKGIHIVWQG